jgi:hypothetical protein
MTRDIKCYATNTTGVPLALKGTPDITHGEYTDGGLYPQTIPPNANGMEIFHLHKTTASIYGVTGSVTYIMGDGSLLQLSFNCPFEQEGQAGSSNCWFYAGFTSWPSDGLSTYVDCTVSLSGEPMNATDPPAARHIVATITIGSTMPG